MNHEMIEFLWGRFKHILESILSEIAAFAFGSDEIKGDFNSDILFCALEDLPYYINQNDPLSQHIINERLNNNNPQYLIIPFLMNKAEAVAEDEGQETAYDAFNALKHRISINRPVFKIIKEGLNVAGNKEKSTIVNNFISFSKIDV